SWSQSSDPEKKRLLPYLLDMTNQITVMPAGVQNLAIGVAPLIEPDGTYRINSKTGRIQFILRTNPDIWTENLNALSNARGKIQEDLALLNECTIAKEIGTLLSMQENPQSGRNKKILRARILKHTPNPDAVTIDDLRKDPFLSEAKDIWSAMARREETDGYILQADWVSRAGRSSEDFDRLSKSQR